MASTKQLIAEGRFVRFVNNDGWEYAERKNITGIVAIVATTEDRRWILVEQFRRPVDAPVIELPAGLVGDVQGEERESFEAAAQRELIEETGYRAEKFEFLTEGPVSAGITNEVITFLRARGLEKVASGGGDRHEDIFVHEIPLTESLSRLKRIQKEGVLVDPKVYAALFFLRDLLDG